MKSFPTTHKKRGFVLLIAVIFMSVMLSFALALGSLSYKQQLLASSAIESQFAFYAADSALECALYADQRLNNFSYALHNLSTAPSLMTCSGVSASRQSYTYNATHLLDVQRFSLNAGTRCADVTVDKAPSGQTFIYSQGYNVPCENVGSASGARMVSRGLRARY
jgi:Tfp pilus assembly protein PilX